MLFVFSLIAFEAAASTITIVRDGTGGGTVTASSGSIACGATCSGDYADGAMLTLTALPADGSQFTGWLGPCTGAGISCSFQVNGVATATATFASPPIAGRRLDADGSGGCDTLTDGLLVARHLLGITESGLVTGGLGATAARTLAADIDAFLDAVHPALDLDGNGQVDAPTDGVLALRYLLGFRGNALVLGALGSGWTRDPATMAAYSDTLCAPLPAFTLAVSKVGSGTVTSTGAIDCGATCQANYPLNTGVTLTATPAQGSTFGGWSGGGCSGTQATCTVTMSAARTVTATFGGPPNIAFVTTTSLTGSMGGLAGADAICQNEATGAALSGTFRAVLSSATTDAATRLAGASGWVRPDGKPVANTLSDLLSGRLHYPIRLTASGVDAGHALVRTATVTGTGGYSAVGDCTGFTSTTGNAAAGFADAQGNLMYQASGGQCTVPARLFCVGVDKVGAVSAPTPPPSHRKAFTTSAAWVANGGGGLAGADAVCQSEAASASLPGTYKALLATTTATAASRFNTSGDPWVRVDGVVLAPTAAGLFTATLWGASPGLTADGSQFLGNIGIWSGSADPLVTGTSNTTCQDWAGLGFGSGGRAGYSHVPSLLGTDASVQCVSAIIHLVCLQQ